MHFEYATVVFGLSRGLVVPKLDHEGFQQKLNEYGRDGWELVNVVTTNRGDGVTDEVISIFKRPIQ